MEYLGEALIAFFFLVITGTIKLYKVGSKKDMKSCFETIEKKISNEIESISFMTDEEFASFEGIRQRVEDLYALREAINKYKSYKFKRK